MQTFLPYPSFEESARVLDRQRLGKQRVEAWQILQICNELNCLQNIRVEPKTPLVRKYKNHPAIRMWYRRDCFYYGSLCYYGIAICDEWIKRGYKDTMQERFFKFLEYKKYNIIYGNPISPPWLGDNDFHLSHKSNLLRKDWNHYSQYFDKSIPIDLPYVWPK